MSFVSMRAKEFFANKWAIVLTLFIIAIAMWVLNYLTPESGDDYWYKFIFVGKDIDVEKPIISFKDVMISQYTHYFYVNGRSVVHILVQLFTGILGKPFFNICNAVVFVLFIYIITHLCAKVTALNLLLASSFVILLYPTFGVTALWMTGSINYLWSSTAICMFLLSIDQLKTKPLNAKYVLWAIPCFFAGWTHEGITFPLTISLCIYIFINRNTICSKAIFPLVIAFILGTFVCTFAPSTFTRTGLGDGINIYQLFRRIIIGLAVCVEIKCLYVVFGALILSYCCFKKDRWMQWFKKIYAQNIIICNAMILSFGVIFLSGYLESRGGIGVCLFSIILLLRILMQCEMKNYIKVVICVGGTLLYSYILFWTIKNYKDNQRVMAQIESRESNIILYEERKIPIIVESYILKLHYEKMWNQMVATTYHYDKISFIPASVYRDIISQNNKIKDINKQRDYPVYVVPINYNYEKTIHPYFILHPTDFNSLPFYIKPFASKLDRYSATEVPVTTGFGVLNIEGQNYLFVEKNDMIDNRLKDIVLR